jgi:hypothetical protein
MEEEEEEREWSCHTAAAEACDLTNHRLIVTHGVRGVSGIASSLLATAPAAREE